MMKRSFGMFSGRKNEFFSNTKGRWKSIDFMNTLIIHHDHRQTFQFTSVLDPVSSYDPACGDLRSHNRYYCFLNLLLNADVTHDELRYYVI